MKKMLPAEGACQGAGHGHTDSAEGACQEAGRATVPEESFLAPETVWPGPASEQAPSAGFFRLHLH